MIAPFVRHFQCNVFTYNYTISNVIFYVQLCHINVMFQRKLHRFKFNVCVCTNIILAVMFLRTIPLFTPFQMLCFRYTCTILIYCFTYDHTILNVMFLRIITLF